MKRSPDHRHPCRFCGAFRCVCVCVARIRLVAAECDALDAIASRARELVAACRARGEHLDGVVRLAEALATFDAAAEARKAGP